MASMNVSQMRKILESGASVMLTSGRVITNPADLPSEAELAKQDADSAQALKSQLVSIEAKLGETPQSLAAKANLDKIVADSEARHQASLKDKQAEIDRLQAELAAAKKAAPAPVVAHPAPQVVAPAVAPTAPVPHKPAEVKK